ncbi:hypothetical protein AB2J24_07035 [Lentilitoribacter sp. EG35]
MRTKVGELGKASSQGLIGYLCVVENNRGNIPNLAPGLVLDNKTDAPPWIIVDHDLRTMTIPNWPISLWKVRALKPIKPQGHQGNYTRCRAIKVLERLPAYKVFGEVDTGLCNVLEFAQRMTLDQAIVLSKFRAKNAHEFYNLAWHRWLHHNPTQSNGYTKDYEGILDIGGLKAGSPVGTALTLIHNVLFDQAGRVDPENAYVHEDDGTPHLGSPWNKANSALNGAALSFGASEFFDPEGLEEMRRPMREVSQSLVDQIEQKLRQSEH